jgi:hypothetical protein
MDKKYSDRRYRRAVSIAAACLAALAAAPIASCQRKASAAVQPASGAVSGRAAAPTAEAAPAAGMAAAPSRGSVAPTQSPPRPAPPLAASLRAFALGARAEPRMPEDFSLGPLQSMRPSSAVEAKALAVARAFLDGVAAGKVDAALFLPEARDALSALLAPAPVEKGSAIAAARIGAMIVEGGSASLRVRLPGPEAGPRTEGLLSLREEDGSWYVEALALDPPAAAELAFAPGEARASP